MIQSDIKLFSNLLDFRGKSSSEYGITRRTLIDNMNQTYDLNGLIDKGEFILQSKTVVKYDFGRGTILNINNKKQYEGNIYIRIINGSRFIRKISSWFKQI